MSNVKCVVKNNSGYVLTIAIPPGAKDRFRGSDWDYVADVGVSIPVGAEIEVCRIADPGIGTAHWGWVYLYSAAKNSYIQLYAYIWKVGDSNNQYSLGYFNSDSDKDNAQPSGVSLGTVSYDSNTNTVSYNFSCTQTQCIIRNNSGYDLTAEAPIGGDGNQCKGPGYWNFIVPMGTVIKKGESMQVGILGNPNENERAYFGWIYFFSTAKRRYIQLYINSTSSGQYNQYKCSLGYFNTNSTEGIPQPDGLLGNSIYDSSTNTAIYDFSCTQTSCIIKNETGHDLFVAIPVINGMQFRGEQMLGVSTPDMLIPHGKEAEVGRIGDPDKDEPDYHGWIYFLSRRYNNYVQLYIRSSNNKANYVCSIGLFDKNSSEDMPQPAGTLGEASYDTVTNTATYILK